MHCQFIAVHMHMLGSRLAGLGRLLGGWLFPPGFLLSFLYCVHLSDFFEYFMPLLPLWAWFLEFLGCMHKLEAVQNEQTAAIITTMS